jgi:hypothetical protein
MWCKHPDCEQPAKYQVYVVKDIIKYSIDHCDEHRKWAVDYLERYTGGGQNEHTE